MSAADSPHPAAHSSALEPEAAKLVQAESLHTLVSLALAVRPAAVVVAVVMAIEAVLDSGLACG